MKLRAGRQYKNDISDVIGILREHDNQGNEEEIFSKKALVDFEKDYPEVLKESNLNDVLKFLKSKKEN